MVAYFIKYWYRSTYLKKKSLLHISHFPGTLHSRPNLGYAKNIIIITLDINISSINSFNTFLHRFSFWFRPVNVPDEKEILMPIYSVYFLFSLADAESILVYNPHGHWLLSAPLECLTSALNKTNWKNCITQEKITKKRKIIKYVLLQGKSVNNWQRLQDVRSHGNNSISCFVCMPQSIKKNKDDFKT